mmetsp:Transcript_33162/g.44028  ORF Transcript_33162/g.44028 Transcript_33162/m.44028 type:complete len:95 (-) Transcript_33162:478-762(-)
MKQQCVHCVIFNAYINFSLKDVTIFSTALRHLPTHSNVRHTSRVSDRYNFVSRVNWEISIEEVELHSKEHHVYKLNEEEFQLYYFSSLALWCVS